MQIFHDRFLIFSKVVKATTVLWNIGLMLGDAVGYEPDVNATPAVNPYRVPDGTEESVTEAGNRQRFQIARLLWRNQVRRIKHQFSVFLVFYFFFGFPSKIFVAIHIQQST